MLTRLNTRVAIAILCTFAVLSYLHASSPIALAVDECSTNESIGGHTTNRTDKPLYNDPNSNYWKGYGSSSVDATID
jgi:hypothetical protein